MIKTFDKIYQFEDKVAESFYLVAAGRQTAVAAKWPSNGDDFLAKVVHNFHVKGAGGAAALTSAAVVF